MRSLARRYATSLAALAIVAAGYIAAAPERLDGAERARLAATFRFTELPLPEPASRQPRRIREVNPSVEHIAAWISSVGAGIGVADLDGDGLDDDACHVDPRDDSVTVAPLPGGRGRSFAPSTLTAPGQAASPTVAPMGCLPADLDEDGAMDLLVYYWGRAPLIFLRTAGGYRPVELVDDGPRRWYTNAATAADVDGDGHADLVIGNYFADGDRVLDPGSSDPVQMQRSMSRAENGGTDRIFLWTGPGRFREAKGALPEDVARGWTLALGAYDLDGDLLPELYFAHDFGRDRLLHNRSRPGRPRFAVLEGSPRFGRATSKVVGRDSFKGMGVDFGDLNADGRADIVVSNIAAEFALEESHFAFMSSGDVAAMRRGHAPFVDLSERLGLARSGWAWDLRLDDFDNDGTLEELQATGFVRGEVDRWPELHELAMGNDTLLADPAAWPRFGPGADISGHEANAFFVRRDDRGRFHDVAAEAGFGREQVTRGIATADVDGDGDLDAAVANQWERSYLYRNDCPSACGEALQLRLVLPVDGDKVAHATGGPAQRANPYGAMSRWAPPRGRPAVGAAATVHLADGRTLTRQVDGGNGHSGKRAPTLHFGLGDSSAAVRVELRWRDERGRPQAAEHRLPAGRHTIVLRGAP